MGKLADEVQAAFQARGSRTVTIPEWGNRVVTVFPITIGQLTKIQAETDDFRRAARIIQVRGKNADGSAMFDEVDFETLCTHGIGQYGPKVIVRVAGEIMADIPAGEAAEGN